MRAERELAIAIVGATGAVGSEVLRTLEERQFPVGEVRLFASARSAGEFLEWRSGEARVEDLESAAFADVDVAFFCAGGAVSAEYAPRAVDAGAVVIDKSSHFRMHPDVPLVVPEVNSCDLAERHLGIVASPNCTTIPIVVALKPIVDAVGIERVVASSYQAVSGGGKRGIEALSRETVDLLNMRAPGGDEREAVFPRRIAFNCIPQVDAFLEDGSTREEAKVIAETRRVLHLESLPIAVTCVHVPTFYGHAVALTVELAQPLDAADARQLLREAPGVILCDLEGDMQYPTAADVGGTDAVYVGRVRNDPSHPHGLQLWVAADNVRKGAALNAVQIAEILAREI
ncbi:MAG: aspartate-semialdehyde dehydrogenase [Polyangiaceae bacterium UTPRO1]|nr:aspartate-semialdehyde dehydrogenase [Myxococcales bacterium]OQY68681.1 MAG: aspartate-semialdehyde dehydrogenase [Polyangiaceae bacterium UTPRO1]